MCTFNWLENRVPGETGCIIQLGKLKELQMKAKNLEFLLQVRGITDTFLNKEGAIVRMVGTGKCSVSEINK